MRLVDWLVDWLILVVGEGREGRSGRFRSGNLCKETFAGRGSCLAVGLDLVVSEKLTYW